MILERRKQAESSAGVKAGLMKTSSACLVRLIGLDSCPFAGTEGWRYDGKTPAQR